MSLVRPRHLASFVLLAFVFSLACGGSKRPPALTSPEGITPGGGGDSADSVPTQTLDEGPDVQAVEGDYASGTDLGTDYETTYEEGSPLADIHFAYDSASLTEEARGVLERHAVEYNLALGEQRARAAWDYLISLGVASDRLRTVSYGKERPLDPSETEAAYSVNRRAHFAVSQ